MARNKDFDEDEVLGKAICLFWNKGYNATSMQDLVDRLGISRSSLYDTFGDKHTLYLRALQSYQQASGNQMCNLISSAPSARDAVKQLLQFTANNLLSDNQQRGCFMVNAEVEVATDDDAVKDIVCRNEQQVEDAFYKIIKQGQESGEFANQQDARVLARFFYNTVKGIRVSAKSTTDKAFFEDIIKTTLLVLDVNT